MSWEPSISPLPTAIASLSDSFLRRRAEDAWIAGHTLLSAIGDWENWLHLARMEYVSSGTYDADRGDTIARAGKTAIETLCGLAVKRDVFADGGSHLLHSWPVAPSDLLDATYYVERFPEVDREIDRELSLMQVLVPDVRMLLDVLAASPVAVLKPALPTVNKMKEETEPPQKRPVDRAFHAYRVVELLGKTQTQTAEIMNVTQGQVSKWLKAVREYLDAGGILPDVHDLNTPPAKTQSMDPSVIDMGARQDGLTPRQRPRRDPDDDSCDA